MSCETIEKSLIGYLDQELDREEETVVRDHLTQCASCSQRLKEVEQLRSVLLQDASASDSLFEEMRRTLFERIRDSRPSREMVLPVRRRSWAPLWVPVTLSLMLLIGVWIVPGRYQEFAMKRDLTALAKLEEGATSLYPEGVESLEEESAAVDEYLMLAQMEGEASSDDLEEDLELLNALGEGDDLSEEELEEIEEEIASLDEEALS
ncbi:MAG: zf-HC2 domain-containing protein [Candidatus Omnitrophica bacterium]|nr:zf-HC2 domain-containing protein [Candidatus Omnitrophota bacterium]